MKILENKIEEMFDASHCSKKSSWEYLPRNGHLPTRLQCVGERVDKNAEFEESFFILGKVVPFIWTFRFCFDFGAFSVVCSKLKVGFKDLNANEKGRKYLLLLSKL